MTNQEMYEALIEAGYSFPSGFDITAPLFSFDVYLPLLLPANIEVYNSLQGGLR